MNTPVYNFRPQFDEESITRDLRALIRPGPLSDEDLEGKIRRLEKRFQVFAATAPIGLWGYGLVLTDEMCRQTECYLPIEEIRAAFSRLFSRALLFSPCIEASLVHSADNWLQVLDRLPPHMASANPATLLRRLARDEDARTAFIFANFLPARYGGGFHRYSGQLAFIRSWLARHRHRLPDRINCLDTACGSGEGTYELALLLVEAGFSPKKTVIHGTTLEPLELFAAAHGFFPHDLRRQHVFRSHLQPLLVEETGHILFFRENLMTARGGSYDLILCNGLLGGPFLHKEEALADVMGRLAGRLAPGGILLAADRFHGGWKRAMTSGKLEEILARSGLEIEPVTEGIAGRKDLAVRT